jgi:hypothetical protein
LIAAFSWSPFRKLTIHFIPQVHFARIRSLGRIAFSDYEQRAEGCTEDELVQNTNKSADNGHAFLNGRNHLGDACIAEDVKAEEAIPEFPALKEKAPPVPPPVAESRPPVPPPVDASLPEEAGTFADPPVQVSARTSVASYRKRKFPRRQMSLVAAVLVLFCFGLGSDDNRSSRSQVLETIPVAFSDTASLTPEKVHSRALTEATDYVVEEFESDINLNSLLPTSEAPQVVEVETGDSEFVEEQTETIEVAKASIPLPNATQPERDSFDKPIESADLPAKLDVLSADESEVCQLELDTRQLLGTAVRWAETANEAAMIADDQGKLVYLIQVSGNFEIPEFT